MSEDSEPGLFPAERRILHRLCLRVELSETERLRLFAHHGGDPEVWLAQADTALRPEIDAVLRSYAVALFGESSDVVVEIDAFWPDQPWPDFSLPVFRRRPQAGSGVGDPVVASTFEGRTPEPAGLGTRANETVAELGVYLLFFRRWAHCRGETAKLADLEEALGLCAELGKVLDRLRS